MKRRFVTAISFAETARERLEDVVASDSVRDPSQFKEEHFVRRALIAIALVAGVFLLWQLRAVLVLMFAAVLIATIVRAIADPLQKVFGFPERLAVMLAVISIVGGIAGVTWMVGAELVAQGQAVAHALPQAARAMDNRLSGFGIGHAFQQTVVHLDSSAGFKRSDLTQLLPSATLVIASLLIVFFGGLFLAAQPRLYGVGLLKLFPPTKRALIAEALNESEGALRLWLKGQLIAMVLVGLMTFMGLLLLGVRSPLALSLISGALEFIPYAGAITSAIPAIMVALVQSPHLALWTIALYVIVHHVEAYLIQPLVQQFAVEIPAVITLFALLAFGMLFGIAGILLAAPIAVVSYVLVKRLYVIEALDTPTPIPGAAKSPE